MAHENYEPVIQFDRKYWYN